MEIPSLINIKGKIMLKKLIGGLFIISISFGQTTANPQFSVVGDLIMNDLHNNPNLYSSGIEIAVQGYVNPFARADVYLHKHNDESAMALAKSIKIMHIYFLLLKLLLVWLIF